MQPLRQDIRHWGGSDVTISSLLVERQRMITKVYNEVLTPEQRTKADQLRERMHGRIEGFLDGLENSTD